MVLMASRYRRLVYEVDAEEVEDQAACDVVGKRSKIDVSFGELLEVGRAYLSGDTEGKSALLASVVWIRREAERVC